MSRGEKLCLVLFGLVLLAQVAYAADSSLEKAKRDAIYGYSSERAVEELERLAPPVGFVLLSYEEEFLLYNRAIQDADAIDKPKYWEHIDFLLAKHDSIVAVREKLQVVGGECLLEKRHLAINVNHRDLRFAMAVRNIPRETREFYGIYLERLALNYGGGEPMDYSNSIAEWNEFRKRYPGSPYLGWVPPASPETAKAAEDQHLSVAPKWMHWALLGGYSYAMYSGGLEKMLEPSTGFNIMAEWQMSRILFLLQMGSTSGDDFSDFSIALSGGFAFMEWKYFSADVIFGVVSESLRMKDVDDIPSSKTMLVGVQADGFIPVTNVLDIDIRAQFSLHYSSFEIDGRNKGGLVEVLNLSAGVHFGAPKRSGR